MGCENTPMWASTLLCYRVIRRCHRHLTPRCRQPVAEQGDVQAHPPFEVSLAVKLLGCRQQGGRRRASASCGSPTNRLFSSASVIRVNRWRQHRRSRGERTCPSSSPALRWLPSRSSHSRPPRSTDYPAQRADIEAIVKDYLAKNPELLQGAIEEYVKRRSAKQAAGAERPRSEGQRAAIVRLAAAGDARRSRRQRHAGGVLRLQLRLLQEGAPADKLELLKSDPKLKVVLKELPVLGANSLEAAEVAVAVRMQDAERQKYLDFHKRLMSRRGQANRAAAITAAQ